MGYLNGEELVECLAEPIDRDLEIETTFRHAIDVLMTRPHGTPLLVGIFELSENRLRKLGYRRAF